MASERTKSLKKKILIFGLLDFITWISVAVFTIVSVFCLIDAKDPTGTPIFSDQFKQALLGIGITTIIGIIFAIIIKDKIRTAVFIICVIACSIMYKEIGMYIILSIWLIDEYVFNLIYKHCKTKIVINKEIDLRG